jgi:O-antigen/teichoic acid export membrane protein
VSRNKKGLSLIKNTFIVGLGTVASKAIIFLMAPFFSKWLSTEAYGEFDLISTYVSLILPFCTLSIYEAVFRFLLDDFDEKKRKVVISSSFSFIVVGTLFFVLVYYLGSLLFSFIRFDALIIMLLLCQLFYTYMSEVARGLKKLAVYSAFSFISVILLTILSTVNLLVLKMGLRGIVLGYSLGYLISAIGLFIATKTFRYLSLQDVSITGLKELISYSWPLIPNSISWWVVSVSDRVIIRTFIGLAANGIYAVANKVPSIVSILFSVFHISWVQSASESISDDDYIVFCNNVYNKLFTFVSSVGAVLIGCNFIVYNYVFDTKYSDAYYYTPILIVSIVFSCLSQFMGGIMIAKKQTKKNGATNVVAAISNIIINLAFVKRFGLYAAAGSTLCSYLILFLMRKHYIGKEMSLKLSNKNKLVLLYMILIAAIVFINKKYLNISAMVFSFIVLFALNKEFIVLIFQKFANRKTI